MDTYRGNFSDHTDTNDEWPDLDNHEEEVVNEPPPNPVGQDERRMQVRAYNHWASLLGDRAFPSIEDLEPDNLPDFGPYSVLLDFTGGIENPAIRYLGDALAKECGTDDEIHSLDDVPSRSLLSRITDHYMQILANQAPIGFEAEFVNQRESTILYRGILLPFSSDDDTIDFIYGVINWKELADQRTTDALLLEIDQALEEAPHEVRHDELTNWADSPVEDMPSFGELDGDENVLDLGAFAADEASDDLAFPAPQFGALDGEGEDSDLPAVYHAEPLELSVEVSDDMGLADWLASARELAEAARGSEDRTRQALYAAIGRAYDFSLAAVEAPEEFNELVADYGLTVQDRAPMTPVVKLVFGADYDKTRLTEYATALSHAHRVGIARGSLGQYLASAPGGLKGIVGEERRAKRAESGVDEVVRDTPREALARKLRQLESQPLDTVSAEGSEFTLLVARRLPTGEVVLLGEVGDDVPLLERAARKLLG
ncbi:MAG: PAS domain-containing protein [Pseudomonadota bacterium]